MDVTFIGETLVRASFNRNCLAVGLLASVACGDTTYIILEVRSSLTIPDRTDRLELSLYEYMADEPLSTWPIALEPTDTFPLEVGIVPNAGAPSPMDARIDAWLEDVVVAYVRGSFEWQRDAITRVKMPAMDPPND